eukprot:m.1641612 g.1641612  ORF g.1641612 m.1641612 type:complete len:70 (-) comp48583_c0_seq1:72-281(-)
MHPRQSVMYVYDPKAIRPAWQLIASLLCSLHFKHSADNPQLVPFDAFMRGHQDHVHPRRAALRVLYRGA